MSRRPFDVENLVSRSVSSDCFICEYVAGNPEYNHVEVFSAETAIVFLDRYPTIFGSVMVAPRLHIEGVTADFTVDSYISLQRLVYYVSEAVRGVLNPERVYVLSIGSQTANSHVHWHIVPLPEGTPLEEQQYRALMHEYGTIDTTDEEQRKYAKRLHDLVSATYTADA